MIKKKRTEPYTIYPQRLIRDKELNKLSVHARWLFMVICTEWNSKSPNKQFKFTYKQIKEITGFRNDRISACLKELTQSKFIEVVTNGGLYRNPNEYTINTYYMKLRQDPRILTQKHTPPKIISEKKRRGPGNTN